MALNFFTTDQTPFNGVKVVVYGSPGSGKTCLSATLPNPIILDFEGGTLSLSNSSILVASIGSVTDFYEAVAWLESSNDAKSFESVSIDSISILGKMVLEQEKSKTKDGRLAFQAMRSVMDSVYRRLRILQKHVYYSARLDRAQDDMGRMLYSPDMPSGATTKDISHEVDFVFALKPVDGYPHCALQTKCSDTWIAKSRSSILDPVEPPDLGYIINKIIWEQQNHGQNSSGQNSTS